MMKTEDYIGKSCPYCKGKFKEGDDIVICSECEMPHHKECWIENRACTTFGCTGTIKNNDGSDVEDVHFFCPNCGTELEPGSIFCGSCGSSVTGQGNAVQTGGNTVRASVPPTQAAPAAPPIVNVPTPQPAAVYPNGGGFDPDLQIYIGPGAQRYMQIFTAMKASNCFYHWDLYSFIAAPYWMLYRKMYIYGIGLLALQLVLFFLGAVGYILIILLYVASGFFGSFLYLQNLEKNVQTGKLLPEPQKLMHIKKTSGVSLNSVYIGAITTIIVLIISLL